MSFFSLLPRTCSYTCVNLQGTIICRLKEVHVITWEGHPSSHVGRSPFKSCEKVTLQVIWKVTLQGTWEGHSYNVERSLFMSCGKVTLQVIWKVTLQGTWEGHASDNVERSLFRARVGRSPFRSFGRPSFRSYRKIMLQVCENVMLQVIYK